MIAKSIERNAFNALCALAGREHWCWKILCTTCGHMHFRYALREILDGKHPDSPSWVVHKENPVLKRGGDPKKLGPLPSRGHWSIVEQRNLLQSLAGANLQNIAAVCPFPDWLGYLGLGLLYSEVAEREKRELTRTWVPQLLKLLPPDTQAHALLESIVESNTRVLSWRDLEALEATLRNLLGRLE